MEIMKKKTILVLVLVICFVHGVSSCATNPVEHIAKVRSGIAQISLVINNKVSKPLGSAFLVEGGLVTNSHVLSTAASKQIAIRFADTDPNDRASYIVINNFKKRIAGESPKSAKDYVYLKFDDPRFKKRHVFQFSDSSNISVGEQVVFLGFPFGDPYMTSHCGYISAIYTRNNIEILQLDGSVNGGNSGGPLLDLKAGKVVGIITRINIGFIALEFDKLIKTLQQNQVALEQVKGMMKAGKIDPFQAIQASQSAMEQIAKNLRQSANVGIGYAYSSNYVRDDIIKKRMVTK